MMDRPGDRTPQATVDPRLPQEMALVCETAGAAKAARDVVSLTALAVLAGAFIAFGGILMTVAVTGAGEMLPFGVVRLIAGVVFSLGLILVVIGGAELFTGDNLMVMAWAGRAVTLGQVLRVWLIVFIGNTVGGVGTAVLVFLAGHHTFGGGALGKTALTIAAAKVQIPFTEALFLGVLCNVLVCLAVWMTFSARTVIGKIAVIVPPVTAFVAAGFEHSIANIYFFAFAHLIQWFADPAFWQAAGIGASAYAALTPAASLMNLVPVTIGNVFGGSVLVGAVYWFVYLRRR